MGRASRISCRSAPRSSTPRSASGRTSSSGSARTSSPDEAALLSIPDTPGEITDAGVHTNVSVGVRYLDSWLHGVGAAAIDNLMEDAATAEISRSQIWQWVKHGRVSEQQVRDEIAAVEAGDEAKQLFASLALADQLEDFLTLPAYERLD